MKIPKEFLKKLEQVKNEGKTVCGVTEILLAWKENI
jgi:hypothetical protein